MSLNSVNFDFKQCMFRKEKIGTNTGRAVIFREAGNHPLTYTFESNYATGIRINTLNPRYDVEKMKKIMVENDPI